MINRLKKWIREPLIHYLLIGAAIYGFYWIYAADTNIDDERTITVTAGDLQALNDQWKRLWKRPPTKDELARVIRDFVRVKILHREAVAMGLDAGDTVIERRLAQKLELLAQSLATPKEPADQELKNWYVLNQDRFKQPDRYTVTHIFFDPDKRGTTALEDAKTTLNKITALVELPSNYSEFGDRFVLQNYYPERSERELSKLFGSGFVEQIVKLQPGKWHGPILSGYGAHLVLVNKVSRGRPPTYEDVKAQIKEAWMAEQVRKHSKNFIDNLLLRYEIEVEDTELPLTVPAKTVLQ